MLRLLVFGFTIISGIVLLTVCFIMCPILLSKVREESFVMYLMYFMGAFLLWILLMAFACCLWRINEVCLCCFRNQWIHQQKMNDTEDIEDAENVILFEKVHIQSKSTHISYI